MAKPRPGHGHNASAMTAAALIFSYVTLWLGGLVALTVYTEFRGRKFRPAVREDRIFRCTHCGLVYTDDPDVDRSRCSQCGKLNDAIKF